MIPPPSMVPLSLVDPNSVWLSDGQIYRQVAPPGCPLQDGRWAHSYDFFQTQLFKDLQDIFLVPCEYTPGEMWIKPVTIRPFIQYLYWTRAMVRDALMFSVDMNIFMAGHPENCNRFMAPDCHVHNVAFIGANPCFIDLGAFTDKWNLETIYSSMKANGASEYIGLKNTKWGSLSELRDELASLQVTEARDQWDDYASDGVNTCELELIMDWIGATNLRSVCDVGSNSGAFAIPIAKEGIRVTAIDSAPKPLTELFLSSRAMGLSIFCALLRINSNTTELLLAKEMKSDACFTSSMIHHLSMSGMTFEQQQLLWDALSDRWLMIEWIPKDDYCLRHAVLPDWYQKDEWLKSLGHAKWSLRTKASNPSCGTREWFLFEKV